MQRGFSYLIAEKGLEEYKHIWPQITNVWNVMSSLASKTFQRKNNFFCHLKLWHYIVCVYCICTRLLIILICWQFAKGFICPESAVRLSIQAFLKIAHNSNSLMRVLSFLFDLFSKLHKKDAMSFSFQFKIWSSWNVSFSKFLSTWGKPKHFYKTESLQPLLT